jgi:hypothetical protein
MVVPAHAGTHTPWPIGQAIWQTPFVNNQYRWLGPCFRRDDGGIGIQFASSIFTPSFICANFARNPSASPKSANPW